MKRNVSDANVAIDVARQRLKTRRRVTEADSVAQERLITGGRVADCGCIAAQGCRTDGGVADAGCVGNERNITDGRVVSSGAAEKREGTDGCVAVGGIVIEGKGADSGVESTGRGGYRPSGLDTAYRYFDSTLSLSSFGGLVATTDAAKSYSGGTAIQFAFLRVISNLPILPIRVTQ